ncbi:MAG: NifB/NifX family molybdenum-iron cluster-binding protein [Ignisphaera sp.]
MKRTVIVAIPVAGSGQNPYVFPHFGGAPFFAIVEIDGNSFRVAKMLKNEHVVHGHGQGHGHLIIEELARQGVEAVVVASIGQGAFYQLRSLGMKIYVLPKREKGLYNLEEAIKMLIENRISEVLEPVEHEDHVHNH